jgi:hypothetical protein
MRKLMATFSYLRAVATAFVLALFAADALAVGVAKGPSGDRDKDKNGNDSRASVERSVSSSNSSATSAAPTRDSSPSRTTLVLGGAGSSARTPAYTDPAMQSRFSGPSPAFHENRRDRWDNNCDDRGCRDDRNDRSVIYACPYGDGFVNGIGTLVGIGPGVLRVESNGAIWQVKPDLNVTFQLNGTAGPDFLRTGLVVKFEAAFDPSGNEKDKAIAPLTDLEIITPHPGETIGAVPAGSAAKQDANQPATARYLVVIGNITRYKQKELTVSAGNHVFRADLDSVPQIKVRTSDIRFARVGDQVQLTGYAVRRGLIVANQVLITMAAPLGDPLAEFDNQKPIKLAAAKK